METKLLNALVAHYQAELQRGEANLICFFKNASGVGDHSDIIGEMTKLVDTIAHARMSLQVLNDMVQQEPAQTPAAADD